MYVHLCFYGHMRLCMIALSWVWLSVPSWKQHVRVCTYICANGSEKKRDYIAWGWICACLHTFLRAWRAKIKMSPWKAVQCRGWSLILLERMRLGGEAWANTLRCVGRRIRCNVGDEISSDRWSIYSSERFAKPSQIDTEAVSTVGWFSTLLPITGRMLQVEIARKKRRNQVCV